MSATLGILGGMGPLATVDFIEKIINRTPAQSDQDHLPLIVHAVPQIPDRTASLMADQASPLPAMRQGLKTLIGAGVGAIAIPCNTAHHWYQSLAQQSSVPILHIAHACAENLKADGIRSVGLMATDGTLKAGFYPEQLRKMGIELELPSPELQRRVMAGIYRVKSGEVEAGGLVLEDCLEQLLELGVQKVILGCTEIPLALARIGAKRIDNGLDATEALAAACVRWYLVNQQRDVA